MEGHDRGAARTALIGALVVIASFVAGKAARDAIVLASFDVTLLPLFVGGSAIVSLPIVLLVGRLLARHGPRGLVPILNVLSASLLFAEWVLFEIAPKPAAIAIFFHLTLFGAVLVSGFWSIVNERFDARAARRHIGRIGVGATVGGILGGLVVERAAVYLEPSAILLVIAGMQLICGALEASLTRGGPRTAASASKLESGAAIKLVARTPLLRNLALLVVFGAIAATALDYVFKVEIVEASGTEGPLRFFAIYYTATNILTAIAQILLARFFVEKLGVARSVGVLPATVTVSSIVALAVPGLASIVIARSAEMIVRSSIYRAAYELVYTPLAEQYKRSTKIILDVGAERIGDLLGAQLIGLLLYLSAPEGALLVTGLIAGAAALVVAFVLPRAYTRALEQSLEVRAPDDVGASVMWSTVGLPTLTDAGDLTGMSLMDLRASSIASPGSVEKARARLTGLQPAAALKLSSARDLVLERIVELRSSDAKLVKRALEPLTSELVPHAVSLLAWDDVASEVTAALRKRAPKCTGALVDVLLDPKQEFAIRRRLPAILEVGEPKLAIWGLKQALADSRFEVRYRCAKALSRLRGQTDLGFDESEVFAIALRELSVDSNVWQNHKLLDPTPQIADDDVLLERLLSGPSSRGLEHVFTILGLALPTGPVRIALQALCTEDRVLRGTALEYLESVLPSNVRALLWPHLEFSRDSEEDELDQLLSALEKDDSMADRLWAAIEPPIARMVAQPGFLDRRAPAEEDAKKIVAGVMAHIRADNHRRLRMFLSSRQATKARFTSWLRTVTKRVGLAYFRTRDGGAPIEVADSPEPRAKEDLAADLMLSHPAIVETLRGKPD